MKLEKTQLALLKVANFDIPRKPMRNPHEIQSRLSQGSKESTCSGGVADCPKKYRPCSKSPNVLSTALLPLTMRYLSRMLATEKTQMHL